MSSDLIALFDMDGTLFDYEGRLRQELNKIRSPYEPPLPEELWDESIPWLRSRMDIIKSVPGFWRDLPRFQLGWDVYEMARELRYGIKILTKGPSSRKRANAWSEKFECIRHNFPEDVGIHIVEDKSGEYGRVLVDDYPQYIQSWLNWRPRGLVIMPAHQYNRDYSHPNVIRYDGNNKDEVLEALTAAKARSPREHWRD